MDMCAALTSLARPLRQAGELAELELIAPPGGRASYSQAGYSLLGRVIEKVVGMPYEKAIASLVFEPIVIWCAATVRAATAS
jgi:CubicO group peptidase (beta-lactamase class C family)